MVYAGHWAGDLIGRAAAARGDAAGPDYAVAMIPPDKVSTVRTWGLAVLRRSMRREAAWRLVEWFCDPAALPERTIRPPATLSGLRRVPWSTAEVLPFMSTALYARAFAPVPRWTAVQAAIAGEVHQALLGGKTAREAADAAEARIRALMEDEPGQAR